LIIIENDKQNSTNNMNYLYCLVNPSHNDNSLDEGQFE